MTTQAYNAIREYFHARNGRCLVIGGAGGNMVVRIDTVCPRTGKPVRLTVDTIPEHWQKPVARLLDGDVDATLPLDAPQPKRPPVYRDPNSATARPREEILRDAALTWRPANQATTLSVTDQRNLAALCSAGVIPANVRPTVARMLYTSTIARDYSTGKFGGKR